MQNFKLFYPFFLLSFFVLTTVSFQSTDKQYRLITLKEALLKKWITVETKSNGKYSGRSVEMTLTRLTSTPLKIVIPAGTTYIPANEEEQTLLQLEDHFADLSTHGAEQIEIAAFCMEAADRCPQSEVEMEISTVQHAKLTELIAYLKGKTIAKSVYQDAVWAISDHHSVSSIVAETQEEQDFRAYVASLTGQKNTWYTSPQQTHVDEQGTIHRSTLRISGRLAFECPPGTQVHQDIYRANGAPFFLSEKTMTAKYGKVTYQFHLQVTGWEKGDYVIKIHDGKNDLAQYAFTV